MTSVKWLTEVKPHPIYKAIKKAGIKIPPVYCLVLVQGIYTPLTLLPNLLIFEYFELHVLYIAFVFIVCVWNGANFYFEIFSETYSDRLQRFLQDSKKEKLEKSPKRKGDRSTSAENTENIAVKEE